MLRARSGFPIDVLSKQNFLGLEFDNLARPDLVANVPVWISAPSGERRLNPAAFTPPSHLQGTLGRKAISGLGMSQLDLSLARVFALKARTSVEFRAEAFNALNHANRADPVRFLDSPHFGTSVSDAEYEAGQRKRTRGTGSGVSIGERPSATVLVALSLLIAHCPTQTSERRQDGRSSSRAAFSK
jgi:hypothetical protein